MGRFDRLQARIEALIDKRIPPEPIPVLWGRTPEELAEAQAVARKNKGRCIILTVVDCAVTPKEKPLTANQDQF
ncbi:MAG: hypothetical protein HZC44_07960 [Geobacter sp.]|nr:hypothetical protein [Geobacter sp.]